MIFVVLNYDYQTHLYQEFFANHQRQILMDQLLLLFLWPFSESYLRWFHQILSRIFHSLDHEKVACQTSGCFMLSCFLTSLMRCRTPLSGFSESNLSALFMLPGLIKCAKVLLMYLAFLLFEFLVSSLFCIAIHSLRNAFTFPSFQSSSLLDKFSLLLVFEALFKTFVVVSSKVTLNYF